MTTDSTRLCEHRVLLEERHLRIVGLLQRNPCLKLELVSVLFASVAKKNPISKHTHTIVGTFKKHIDEQTLNKNPARALKSEHDKPQQRPRAG